MLVYVNNNKPQSVMNISPSDRELQYAQENEGWIQGEFVFVEDMNLYEYNGTTFVLVDGWEAVKAAKEAELEAERLAQIPLMFEGNKQRKLQELNQWHDAQTTAMKAKYSQSEVDSFLDKRNEAMAWRVNNTVATPYVDAMSGGNAEVRIMLLTSILAKVDATAQLEAYVLSKRDAIEVCSTQEELEAIVW